TPKIINRKLRAYYSRTPGLHAVQRRQIEEAFAKAAAGTPFRQIADEFKLRHVTYAPAAAFRGHDPDFQTAGNLVVSPESSPIPLNGEDSGDPLVPILKGLQPGEICKTIIEDDQSYRVIRLTAKDGTKLSAEALLAEKRPFEQWLREHSAHCAVHIGDAELEAKIARKYPELLWVRASPAGD
ncbi:MAG: hypothetical protein ABSE73_22765, partial [Planctomycetota bacterium]